VAQHPVAPAGLGQVQRLVGARDGLRDRFAQPVLGYADRHRQRDHVLALAAAQRFHHAAHPLGERQRADGRRFGQHRQKLFTAIAPEGIQDTDLARHRARKCPQHRVAGGVAVAVVDALEEIDVEQAQAKFAAIAVAPVFFFLHQVGKRIQRPGGAGADRGVDHVGGARAVCGVLLQRCRDEAARNAQVATGPA